ncbi:hypothetical protein, partial [Idiomarina abyssalis]|uniref:hypothetical protein n=1 Tax=Idiomarina abyssalis TaxID=86102 RepID=UPI003A94429B
NSEVKHTSADGSVGSPHARVGHRQTFILRSPQLTLGAFFMSETKFSSLTFTSGESIPPRPA